MSKAEKLVKRNVPCWNTGTVVAKLYNNLLRDFRTTEGNDFFAGAEHDLLTNVAAFRDRPKMGNLENGFVSVRTYKRTKQMENLLKKFRFSTDAYTDDELMDRTVKKFLDDQVRLHDPLPLRCTGRKVLQRARIIARRILGEYPGDEVVENVRFGRKSSIGCPYSDAYLDFKLSDKGAFTGTKETSKFFFDQVLPGDHILQRILKNHDFVAIKEQLNTSYLNLVEVPKTWESYRDITPMTLLGLFFSYGLARVVTSRLNESGLRISKLQDIHRNLVRKYSLTRSHVTADLSAASNSITSTLLNFVLPRPWYCAAKKTFVRTLRIDGVDFSTVSVLPMGNGATFPLETLVFYCIIKAIGELLGVKGTYSVYGDDLIYPAKIHRYVVTVFPQLHLKLNLDKTFNAFPFRESCGADFYRGQDVRSYYVKGEAENLTRVRYEAFLYKVYNGLTARWEPLEIRETLTWILSELAMVSHGILRVPPSYPDYSGVKVRHPREVPLSYELLPFVPVQIMHNTLQPGSKAGLKGKSYGSTWYVFDYLTQTAKKRVVHSTMPYYWLSLQGLRDEVVEDEYKLAEPMLWSPLGEARLSLHGRRRLALEWLQSQKEPLGSSLTWIKTQLPPKVFYVKGRKMVKERTNYTFFVDSRQGSTVSKKTAKTDSISDWI